MYRTEALAELNNAGYANAVKIATLSFDKLERLAKLNLQAAKSVLAESAGYADAIAGVRDVPAWVALNAKLTEAGVESALGYSRGVYGIASAAEAELTALADEAFAAYTKGASAWADKATANAPAGSDVAVNAFKSTVAATKAMFDQFSKASREMASFADSSIRAATASAVSVAKAAGKKAA